jgi:uncharacterized protein HemX
MKAEMEAPEIAAIITAIGGLGTGWFGGLKIGRSQQVEEVKALITQYKDANEFTKQEVMDVKGILSETRNMHHECEESKQKLTDKVNELERVVHDIISTPPDKRKYTK